MKKHRMGIMALAIGCTVLFTGCAYGEAQKINEQKQSQETIETKTNMEVNAETIKNETVTETEDIFSKRDLDSNPDLSEAKEIPVKNNSEYSIDSAGIYILRGQASDFTVKVDAGKEDGVQIVLQDAAISNTDFPVVYVKSADQCFVTVEGDNQLSVSSQYKSDGDINTDAVIFSKDDLTLNGTGTLTVVSSNGNGITSKDDLKITGGTFDITCALDGLEAKDSIYINDGAFHIEAQSDGVQAKKQLVVNGGEFDVTAQEGFEATYVQINGGKVNINASDDGINAAKKSDECDVMIEINGGEITVVMGEGDTDGLDSNGSIVVNGGTIDVTGGSTFDSDGESIYNGGTIIVNGNVSDGIPAQTMGGHGGGQGKGFDGNFDGKFERGFGGKPGERPEGEFGEKPGERPEGEFGGKFGERPEGEFGGKPGE